MKNKKQKITLAVDKDEKADNQLSDTILAHKKISETVKSAYQFSHSDIKMKYLAGRVIEEAKSGRKQPFFQTVKDIWFRLFGVHSLAWSAALSVVLIASFGFVLMKKYVKTEPKQLESFVIFQTQEGESVVRYFNYRSVSKNEKI